MTCRFCAEDVEAGTSKCPHCGERLVAATTVPFATWSGDTLVVPVFRPDVPAKGCVLCGAPGSFDARQRKVTYTPGWVYLCLPLLVLGVCGLVLVVALVFVGQRHATVYLPLCDGCLSGWQSWDVVFYVASVLGLVALPLLGVLAGGAVSAQVGPIVGGVAGGAAWIGLVLLASFLIGRRQVRCTRLEGGEVCLVFPDPQAARRVISAE